MVRLSKKKRWFMQKRQRKLEYGRYINNRRRSVRRANQERWKIITLPRHLDLYNQSNRSEYLAALDIFRRSVVENDKNIKFDFSKTRYVVADAMLLLYAEVDRIIESGAFKKKIKCKLPKARGKDLRSSDYKNSDKIGQVLKQIGLLDLCKQSIDITPRREDVIFGRL